MGHYGGNFPSSTSDTCMRSQSLQVGLTMTQTTNYIPETDIINTHWIILDTCSTISFIININLVQETRACDAGKELWTYTNRVHHDYSYTATITMLPFKVFYNGKSLAKILSFSTASRWFRINIGTYINSVIKVHINDGTNIRFKQCSRGLYYDDTTNMENNTTNNQVNDYTLLNTV